MNERTYTEKEIAQMLERAAELQAHSSKKINDSGLTLSELEAVAADAGLDPTFLRQAAQELNSPVRPLLNHGMDSNATHNFVERIVPVVASLDAIEDAVAELKHRFDSSHGDAMGSTFGNSSTEQIGRTVEWKHVSMSGVETRAMIRPRGNQTHVRLSQRVGLASNLTEGIVYGTLLAGLIGGISGAITDSGLTGLIVLLVAMVVAIPLIYFADKTWRAKKHRELDELADSVVSILQESPVSEQAPQSMTYEESPVIDQSLLDPPDKTETRNLSQKTRQKNK